MKRWLTLLTNLILFFKHNGLNMEIITLSEAIHKMKWGDRFKFNDGTEIIYKKEGFRYVVGQKKFELIDFLDSSQEKGKIIRAESKVLSEFELAKKIHELLGTSLDNTTVRQSIRLADQNGQLKEWQRPEQVELREAVGKFVRLDYDSSAKIYERMVDALENLKQPSV